ncbi:MAG: VOC family protein [Actinobacteria bacterium]|nr:VOC family protein [Actinomycetota bacterium]
MDIDSYDHGVPSWVDLGTPDPARAASFYGELFGWSVEPGPPEAGGYALAELRGKPVAGIGPQQNPGPPVWATYVNVDSADDVAAKVTANGGTLFMDPFDVMDVGRMAVFADPQGAAIGLWEPKAHKGAGIVNEPGTYSWSELVTTDVDAAKAFYAAVFGWGEKTNGGYTEWQLGGRSIAGAMAKPAEMPSEVPPFWGVYFAVDDTDAAVARVTELGGAQIMPPMDIEPGRFAVLADPQGASFNVIKMNEGLAQT